jgi:hypothetical protein
MSEPTANKFIALLVIIAAPFAMGAFFLAWSPVIVADVKIPSLQLALSPPYPGYWSMLVGSADSYEGSVAFGSVLNSTESEVLVTTTASRGNSGGPVVDNEGRVIGTLTSGADDEQYNVAMSLDAMCSKILQCEGKYFWEW